MESFLKDINEIEDLSKTGRELLPAETVEYFKDIRSGVYQKVLVRNLPKRFL